MLKQYIHPAFSVSYKSINKHERHTFKKEIVYTDGSKKSLAIGAGIYSPHYNMKWAFGSYYPDRSSVRAELLAISIALRLFPSGDIVILTDSASSLDLIIAFFENKETYMFHSHNNILLDIHDSILWRQTLLLATKFFKVKAHSGEHGNTIADALARYARIEFEKKM